LTKKSIFCNILDLAPTKERPALSARTAKYSAQIKPIRTEPILSQLDDLYKEVFSEVKKDTSTRNPRDVIDKYLAGLAPNTLNYYFTFLVESDVQVRLSGNLKPTTPRQMTVMYLRQYLWQYIKSNKDLKAKYSTTVFGSSFE
jgi:hypothetical protein